jgi:RNA polymerase sigma factor (sigma-70 family)
MCCYTGAVVLLFPIRRNKQPASAVLQDMRRERFEALVLVWLDAAYALARWLLRDDHAAADATQEASLRAWRYFDGMRSESPKAWFLAIVRNVCMDEINGRQRHAHEPYDDERAADIGLPEGEAGSETPEMLASRASDASWLHQCLAGLSTEHREVLVLREFAQMSYREIGEVIGVPVGTVMSRLSRARDLLGQRVRLGRERSA